MKNPNFYPLLCLIWLLSATTCLQAQTSTNTTVQEEEVFLLVEDMPEPPGGMKAFYEYIGQNLKYPREAHRVSVQGRVFLQFIVDTDGSLTDIKVLKGIGAGCDEEAVKILQNYPEKWKPGKRGDVAVKTRLSLPIVFKLPAQETLSEEPMLVVEEMPEPANGMEDFQRFIAKNIQYPKEARRGGVSGRVFVSFVVNTDGTLSEDKVIRSPSEELGAEAIRVITAYPHGWKAGKQAGKAVRVKMVMPIAFELNGGFEEDETVVEEVQPTIEETKVTAHQQPTNLENPLIILDGEKIAYKALIDIDPENIKSIEVLKGKSALEQYGKEGQNGVVLIFTKKKPAAIEAPESVSKVNIYPNPSKETVNLEFEIPSTSQVQIIAHNQRTLEKEVILENEYKAGKHRFGWVVSQLPADTYILQIYIGKDTIIHRRVLVEK